MNEKLAEEKRKSESLKETRISNKDIEVKEKERRWGKQA